MGELCVYIVVEHGTLDGGTQYSYHKFFIIDREPAVASSPDRDGIMKVVNNRFVILFKST